MKKLNLIAILILILFGFYTDVSSKYQSSVESNSPSSTESGTKSESNYGYQRGQGI